MDHPEYVLLSSSAEPKVLSVAEGLGTGSAKDPYDETLEAVAPQGFFGAMRLRMTLMGINFVCHPERNEVERMIPMM